MQKRVLCHRRINIKSQQEDIKLQCSLLISVSMLNKVYIELVWKANKQKNKKNKFIKTYKHCRDI